MKNRKSLKVFLALFLIVLIAVSFPMKEGFREKMQTCPPGQKLLNGKCVKI